MNNRIRTSNLVSPSLINQIGQLLQDVYLQGTPLQVGSLKKIGEDLAHYVDKFLEFIRIESRINYKSDEIFGLVAYIGKEQQLHIRGYVDGRIESEIEPIMHHYEHLIKPPEYKMFNGMWYSAHKTVEYLLNHWNISSTIEIGDSGSRYHPDQWRYFSKPTKFYKDIKDIFKNQPRATQRNINDVLNLIKLEIQRIKKAPFDCLVKKALRASDFKSHRDC
ncbi:MAG: hypothetical protein HeimC2_45670 [Candidatus Heimdallarchaeota archaeon LC_2]|nr:MAG: hypothetical protein HeimC2_45670 [Candidatus Heimdallarchaeota archaeon LC_2]